MSCGIPDVRRNCVTHSINLENAFALCGTKARARKVMLVYIGDTLDVAMKSSTSSSTEPLDLRLITQHVT